MGEPGVLARPAWFTCPELSVWHPRPHASILTARIAVVRSAQPLQAPRTSAISRV
jgi:hypothetical protein